MSYDIYCYRSKSGKPDQDEATAVIAADTDKWAKKDRDAATKLAIVKAVIEYNPRLIATDFQYGDVAKLTVDVIEKETKRFGHIEINTPDEDPSVQLIVYDNDVFITASYGYHDNKAEQLFRDISAYVDIIRKTAGYFVDDPQTGQTFDPAEHTFDGLNKYLPTNELASNHMIKPEPAPSQSKKHEP